MTYQLREEAYTVHSAYSVQHLHAQNAPHHTYMHDTYLAYAECSATAGPVVHRLVELQCAVENKVDPLEPVEHGEHYEVAPPQRLLGREGEVAEDDEEGTGGGDRASGEGEVVHGRARGGGRRRHGVSTVPSTVLCILLVD